MKHQRWTAALILLWAWAVCQAATYAVDEAYDLGPNSGTAVANNTGVAGRVNTGIWEGFAWDYATQTRSSLPLPGGASMVFVTDISASGNLIVGKAPNTVQIVKWTQTAGSWAAENVAEGEGHGINDAGQIVGFSKNTSVNNWAPCFVDTDNSVTSLPLLGTRNTGQSNDLSQDGTAVVGAIYQDWSSPIPVVWNYTSTWSLSVLPLLAGHAEGGAMGISADGTTVAGFSSLANGDAMHAVVWQWTGTEWTANDLGLGRALNISPSGQWVVGDLNGAWFWTAAGGMQQLGNLHEWNTNSAQDVNDFGYITGDGGPNGAYLMHVVPEPMTLTILALGGAALLRKRM